jgi:hypothetical protein
MMLVENVDYELIPYEETDWHVRILTGYFTETIIQFGALQVNEKNGEINFNFELISSPDFDVSNENTDLQSHAADILLSIINTSLSKSKEE